MSSNLNKALSKINIAALGLILCTLTAPKAHATDTLIYSTPSGSTPITDGAGTITSTSTIFYDATSSSAGVSASGGTGNATPNADFLQFGDNAATGENGTAGTVTITGTIQADGLVFEPTSVTSNIYTLSGGTIALQGSTPTLNVTNPYGAIINSALTTAAGSTFTVTAPQSGAGGNTTLILSNTGNSFGGNIVLGTSSGTPTTQNALLVFSYAEAGTNTFSGTSAITVYTGDSLRFNNSVTLSSASSLNLTGTGGAGNRGALSLYGGAVAANLQGTITLGGNTLINNRDESTISGNIGQSATSALTISQDAYSTDTILLSGNNTFSGGLSLTTNITSASVKAGSSTAFGSGVLTIDTYQNTNASTIYSDATTLVDLNGQSLTVAGITGAANAGTLGTATATSADNFRVIGNSASGTATLNLSNTSNYTYYGEIEDGTTTFVAGATPGFVPTATQVAGGKTAVTQTGTGTTTLGGNNTFSGDLTISAGAVALTSGATLPNARVVDNATNGFNVSAFTSGFTLGSAQELAGNGSVKGQINTVSGSMINPGTLTTPGQLTLNNGLNVTTSGLNLTFRLDNTSNSDELVLAGGAFTESAGTIINLLNGGTFAGAGTYSILDASLAGGAGDVTLANYTLGTTIAGYTETLVVNGADDILEVQVGAAPEPSTYVMLLGGLVMLVGIGKFRRRGVYVD